MRVLVTRPHSDAERTAQALAARGHEAVLAPVLRITGTGEPPPSGLFDAIVVTSANAAPALPSLGGLLQTLPIFAVGERTASAVSGSGGRDVHAAEGDALSLTDLIVRTTAPGARLLLVAGRDRKAEPEAGLSSAAFQVVVWVAYQADAAERLPEGGLRALRDGGLHVALHYSRRSARVILDLVKDADVAAEFRSLAHVCLSHDVAVPLLAEGVERVIIAMRPHESSLLMALDEWGEKSDRAGSRTTRSG